MNPVSFEFSISLSEIAYGLIGNYIAPLDVSFDNVARRRGV
jgi:hypothetical protein